MTTQIPTSVPMKPLVSTSTTTNVVQVNVDLLKLQKKGILTGEGG